VSKRKRALPEPELWVASQAAAALGIGRHDFSRMGNADPVLVACRRRLNGVDRWIAADVRRWYRECLPSSAEVTS
jgi:hypothetical protein